MRGCWNNKYCCIHVGSVEPKTASLISEDFFRLLSKLCDEIVSNVACLTPRQQVSRSPTLNMLKFLFMFVLQERNPCLSHLIVKVSTSHTSGITPPNER